MLSDVHELYTTTYVRASSQTLCAVVHVAPGLCQHSQHTVQIHHTTHQHIVALRITTWHPLVSRDECKSGQMRRACVDMQHGCLHACACDAVVHGVLHPLARGLVSDVWASMCAPVGYALNGLHWILLFLAWVGTCVSFGGVLHTVRTHTHMTYPRWRTQHTAQQTETHDTKASTRSTQSTHTKHTRKAHSTQQTDTKQHRHTDRHMLRRRHIMCALVGVCAYVCAWLRVCLVLCCVLMLCVCTRALLYVASCASMCFALCCFVFPCCCVSMFVVLVFRMFHFLCADVACAYCSSPPVLQSQSSSFYYDHVSSPGASITYSDSRSTACSAVGTDALCGKRNNNNTQHTQQQHNTTTLQDNNNTTTTETRNNTEAQQQQHRQTKRTTTNAKHTQSTHTKDTHATSRSF